MIYEHREYRAALKERLLERREVLGRAFTFQALAKACRVQKTYISKVFGGDAHLNDDQVYMACDFLGLTTDERDFVRLLHQYERSTVRRYRDELSERMQRLRARFLETEQHVGADVLKPGLQQDFSAYYLSPEMQLVHMYFTIEKFRRDPALIRHELGLGQEAFAAILTELQRLGIIALEQSQWQVRRSDLHLSASSPLYRPYRTLLRVKSTEHLARSSQDSSYSFSVVFTADEPTRQKIQGMFLDFLKSVEGEVKAAPSEGVYQMNFDLFRWSR